MSDAECAEELHRLLDVPWIRPIASARRTAIERAIEVLEWLQQYEADLAKFGPGGEWS